MFWFELLCRPPTVEGAAFSGVVLRSWKFAAISVHYQKLLGGSGAGKAQFALLGAVFGVSVVAFFGKSPLLCKTSWRNRERYQEKVKEQLNRKWINSDFMMDCWVCLKEHPESDIGGISAPRVLKKKTKWNSAHLCHVFVGAVNGIKHGAH